MKLLARVKIVDHKYGTLGTETAEIENLVYPTVVEPGESFQVSYDARNKTSSPLELYGEIRDYITEEILAGSYWTEIVAEGDIKSAVITLSLEQTWTGVVIIGHFGEEICQWITDHGGPTGLIISEVFILIDSYIYNEPPTGYTFIPTLQQIMGVVDYYLGFIESGNQGTGCNF